MKSFKLSALMALTLLCLAGSAFAQSGDIYRQQSDANKMFHKLGRGVVNVLTCWVEVPRNIAIEWEKTDPATGLVLGTVKGAAWGFSRLATGVFEVFTFPLPVPEAYQPLMEPEFVVTDVWGDPIPAFAEYSAVNPNNPRDAAVYPQAFNY
jgi:putative exosortase-associated protein (TIGR04073 family)